MKITADFQTIRTMRWHEFILRFLFGGLVTVLAGMIAEEYGPKIGGLFLAFPAILPASITLVEKHTRSRKGYHSAQRARGAAALDSAGAAIGSVGLLIFGLAVWVLLPRTSTVFTLLVATASWAATALLIWKFCRE